MKPGRAFSLLTGVALLGGIAKFNEMTPEAQTSLLGSAAQTARHATQSWVQSAVATYNDVTGAAALQPAAPAAPQHAAEGRKVEDAPPPQRVAARAADAAVEPPSGNPLWALPLRQLSITRDRPVFSPSRRPPPPPRPAFIAPVAIQQPAKPPEPERPAVSLLGTVIGTQPEDRIGLFLETGTQNIVRLRIGDDHQGWVLRLIKSREATLVKDGEQAAVLELPSPGDPPPPGLGGPMMPGMPAGLPGVGTLPIPATPPTQRQQRRQGR
jgi:hypothetical protein